MSSSSAYDLIQSARTPVSGSLAQCGGVPPQYSHPSAPLAKSRGGICRKRQVPPPHVTWPAIAASGLGRARAFPILPPGSYPSTHPFSPLAAGCSA
ncbi:unnamed protein product [Gadus morhua 'NCC']